MRTAWLRAPLLLSGAVLLYYARAQFGEGVLTVEIRDAATNRPVPAMVCITSLADGKWRTPPDGSATPAYTRVPDFFDPSWKPGDIGPVRLTSGDYRNNQTRSTIYGAASAYPFWTEPAACFAPRRFSIKLPSGRWRLAIEHGIEYLPVFEDFEVRPGQELNRVVSLKRWVDMPRTGWYSGDDHVHYPRTKPEHDEALLTWARAEDVHLVNTVQQRVAGTLTFPQAFGSRARRHEGDFAIVSGQEDPSMDIQEQGHALALNLPEEVWDASKAHLYDVTFDAARRQGGITGYAHLSWAPEFYRRNGAPLFPTWDATLNAIAGRVDFFEILQFRKLGLEDYYDFLSMGIKLAASAGSDMPWGGTIGEVRTYAYTGPSFSIDRWFAALRKGNTFVTNGPMLSLTVNGAMPGEEIDVRPGGRIRVRVRAWAPPEIGSPQTLELVALGKVVRTDHADETANQNALEMTTDVPIAESQWIAARVTSRNGAFAHTSPVYVHIGGKPVADRARMRDLVAKRLTILDHIDRLFGNTRYAAGYAPGELEAHRLRVRQAREFYQRLLL